MNKTELIAAIAEKAGLTRKDSAAALDAFMTAVEESLKAGEKVTIPGFGTFEARERAARSGRNPRTGETIEIAASKIPAFKAGKSLKDSI